jgi:NitT/TauT family transport system substrate-binding protein
MALPHRTAPRRISIFVVAFALFVGACGAGDGGSNGLDRIELQMKFSPSPFWGLYLYGIDEGIFERHGIELELLTSTGTSFVMTQLNEGAVQFANADMIGYLADKAATGSPTTAVMVVADDPIFRILTTFPAETLEDLVGHDVGHGPFDVFRHILPIVLELQGLPRDAVGLTPVERSAVLLLEGHLDAMMVYVGAQRTSVVVEAAEAGVTLWELDLADFGLVNYDQVIVVRNEVLEQDPDLVRRFLAALQESIDGAKAEDPERILDLLEPYIPAMNRGVQRPAMEDQFAYFGRSWTFDPDTVRTLLGYIRDGLGVDHDLEPEDTFTNEFLP